MQYTLLTLIALATWRITCDVIIEDGPFGLYHQTRKAIKAWAEARINQSDIADPADHHWFWLYDGVDCFVCVSFWVSGLLTLLAWLTLGEQIRLFQGAELVEAFLHWLAAAAAARFFDALYTRIATAPTSPPKHEKS